MRKIANEDPEYQALIDAVEEEGNTDRVPLYKKLIPELSTENGLVLLKQKIIVPQKMRREVLSRLHDSHQGIERTKQRARQTVYWPGINSDITNTVESCRQCQERLPSLQKEPMKSDAPPTRAFESTSADLFTYGGKKYLAYVDRLSGFPFVQKFNHDPDAKMLEKVFSKIFVTTGVPVQFRSDQGPQFAAKHFQDFLTRWGVTWAPSSPHYPQSNGHAEAAVKAMQHLVAKTGGNTEEEPFLRGLLEFRNTPRADGRSPAQIVYGRPMRSHVPAHWSSFDKEWQPDEENSNKKALEQKAKAKERYDQHASALQDLKIGQEVRIQDHNTQRWEKIGKIVATNDKRAYQVQIPSGRSYWRNRRFLRPVKTQQPLTGCNSQPGAEEDDQESSRPDPFGKAEEDVQKTPPPPRKSTSQRKKMVRFNW